MFRVMILMATGFVCLFSSPAFGDSSDEATLSRQVVVHFKIPFFDISEKSMQTGVEAFANADHPLAQVLLTSGPVTVSRTYSLEFWRDSTVQNEFGIPVARPNLSNIWTIEFPDSVQSAGFLAAAQESPDVRQVYRRFKRRPQAIFPNDIYFSSQYSLHNDGSYGTVDADIDAPEAWEICRGDSATLVAVVDLGVWSNHPDLTPKVTGDAGYADHGTHVGGIIAANADNGLGVAGINWHARILNKVTDLDPETSVEEIVGAADANACAINCSYGGYEYFSEDQTAAAYAYAMNSIDDRSQGKRSDRGSALPL